MSNKLDKEAQGIIKLENSLKEMELDPRFQEFVTRQKEIKAKIDDEWKKIELAMIKTDTKSIKGDWGSITIAERLNWETTDELPARFYKKVVDTTKLSGVYRLENKAPKGATPVYSKYLTKRIK